MITTDRISRADIYPTWLTELETDSVTEAFDCYTQGSGDGQENFCVVALRDGQLYTVLSKEEE